LEPDQKRLPTQRAYSYRNHCVRWKFK